MPKEITTQTFAIICTLNLGPNRETDRQFGIRKYIKKRLGDDIKILYEIPTPLYEPAGLTLVVEAASQAIVEEAVSVYEGPFAFKIEPVTVKLSDGAMRDLPKYAVFVPKTPRFERPKPSFNSIDAEDIKLWLHFDKDTVFSDIILIDTITFAAAGELIAQILPQMMTVTAYCMPMSELFDNMTNKKSEKIDMCEIAPSAAKTVKPMTDHSDMLISEGSLAFWAPLNPATPLEENLQFNKIEKDTPTPFNGPIMVWPRWWGGKWNLRRYYFLNNYIGSNVTNNWNLPLSIIPGSNNGTTYVIEGNPKSLSGPLPFAVRNELSIWLNNLMLSPEYDDPWPEDSYAGGKLKAYDYILSFFPGEGPIKNGRMLESERLDVIRYAADKGFTEEEFDEVKDHLLLEVGYFKTANKWFDVDGIMDAIYRGVAILSTNDLIEAAEYMAIPPETSKVWAILDEIFGGITAILSAIPVVGSYISAAIHIAWSTVKASLPGIPASAPIEATVAELADGLNKFLENMETASEIQKRTLFTNFGRLKQFSDGVILGIISEEMFFGNIGQNDLDSFTNKKQKLTKKVQAAAANAWLVYCYQQLFTVKHQVSSLLSFSYTKAANPWNPDNGQYRYSWNTPCIFIDDKGDDQNGYMVIDGQTSAPKIVMEKLFGKDSELSVFPIAFFAGINGWKTAGPAWDCGWAAFPGTQPLPIPIKEIGKPEWNKLVEAQ